MDKLKIDISKIVFQQDNAFPHKANVLVIVLKLKTLV